MSIPILDSLTKRFRQLIAQIKRKNGLVLVNVIVIISAVLNTISKPVNTFITVLISRLLAGIYSGFFTGILPLYLSECSSKNLRGLSGTLNQLAIVLGVVAVNVLGLPDLLGTRELWPVLVGLTLVPILFHAVLFFLSESPKYVYINKNDKERARLSKLLFHAIWFNR